MIKLSRSTHAGPMRDWHKHRKYAGYSLWHATCIVLMQGCLYVGDPWSPAEFKMPTVHYQSPDSESVDSPKTLQVEVQSWHGDLELFWYVDDEGLGAEERLRAVGTISPEVRADSIIFGTYLKMNQLDEYFDSHGEGLEPFTPITLKASELRPDGRKQLSVLQWVFQPEVE